MIFFLNPFYPTNSSYLILTGMDHSGFLKNHRSRSFSLNQKRTLLFY